MTYVFYNPLADNQRGVENVRSIEPLLGEDQPQYLDITEHNPVEFLKTAKQEDRIVISGGDGTLHFFVNQCGGQAPEHPVWYFPSGSGNDFMADVRGREKSELVLLNPYINHLPAVYVNGEKHRFINGVGYGIDGYCCVEGDKKREKSDKTVNYTSIAIQGLLFHFKPRNAVVTVDGVENRYSHVWAGAHNERPILRRRNDDCAQSGSAERSSACIRRDPVLPKQAQDAGGVPVYFQG